MERDINSQIDQGHSLSEVMSRNVTISHPCWHVDVESHTQVELPRGASFQKSVLHDNEIAQDDEVFFGSNRETAEHQLGQLRDHLKQRQEEIDHRENLLHARIAQFETLVRSTNLSFQEKADQLRKRETELESQHQWLFEQKTQQEQKFHLVKDELEHENLALESRRVEVDERLLRPDREMQDLLKRREKELEHQLMQNQALL